jgi:hypothetical protein
MVSKLSSALLVLLTLGLGSPTLPASADAGVDYECVNGLCVGMQVRILGGIGAGQSGSIINIDHFQDTLTVYSASGQYLYLRTYEVSAEISQPSSSGCVSNICVGDQVRILVGAYSGLIGQVVDADEYNYTATVYVSGRYIIEDIRDLSLSLRPPVIHYPNYPRNCPIGMVYDVFRGCIRITYNYPRPYPRQIPRPLPLPRHYPVPPRHPAPMPPRTLPRIPQQQPRIPQQQPRTTQQPSRRDQSPRAPQGQTRGQQGQNRGGSGRRG